MLAELDRGVGRSESHPAAPRADVLDRALEAAADVRVQAPQPRLELVVADPQRLRLGAAGVEPRV